MAAAKNSNRSSGKRKASTAGKHADDADAKTESGPPPNQEEVNEAVGKEVRPEIRRPKLLATLIALFVVWLAMLAYLAYRVNF